VVDTRENVLFRQACALLGRSEHLHGLLSDVTYFIGSRFEDRVRTKLGRKGHVDVQAETGRLEQVLERVITGELIQKQNEKD